MTSFALPRRIEARPARISAPAAPAVGRWPAALLVAVLLAVFAFATRGGR
jgi:hypothetical protein